MPSVHVLMQANSDYYTKTELPIRLAFFWMSSNLCSIVASFLAYGILHLRGHLGKAGWRWLFLVEYVPLPPNHTQLTHPYSTYRGLLTFVIGFATFFMMPPSPTQSRTWFRPNGWFTEREETVIVSRVLRDDPTKVTYLFEYLFVSALTRKSRAICTIEKD